MNINVPEQLFSGDVVGLPKHFLWSNYTKALSDGHILTYFFNSVLLSCWNELMFAVTFINKESYQTLTVGMMSMVGTYITQWGIIGAGLMITTIPTILIYLLLNKQVWWN